MTGMEVERMVERMMGLRRLFPKFKRLGLSELDVCYEASVTSEYLGAPFSSGTLGDK